MLRVSASSMTLLSAIKSAGMKLSNISLTAFFILAQLTASGQSLESVLTKGDRLVYQGYGITRSAKQGAPLAALTPRSPAEVEIFSKHFKSVRHLKMSGQVSPAD
jgi:hypothetical protein